jgi:hypothetical protein
MSSTTGQEEQSSTPVALESVGMGRSTTDLSGPLLRKEAHSGCAGQWGGYYGPAPFYVSPPAPPPCVWPNGVYPQQQQPPYVMYPPPPQMYAPQPQQYPTPWVMMPQAAVPQQAPMQQHTTQAPTQAQPAGTQQPAAAPAPPVQAQPAATQQAAAVQPQQVQQQQTPAAPQRRRKVAQEVLL